jgi:hypothetical protein
VRLDITPEPSPEERQAILRALATITAADGRLPASAWWREGLREAVFGDAEPDGRER